MMSPKLKILQEIRRLWETHYYVLYFRFQTVSVRQCTWPPLSVLSSQNMDADECLIKRSNIICLPSMPSCGRWQWNLTSKWKILALHPWYSHTDYLKVKACPDAKQPYLCYSSNLPRMNFVHGSSQLMDEFERIGHLLPNAATVEFEHTTVLHYAEDALKAERWSEQTNSISSNPC